MFRMGASLNTHAVTIRTKIRLIPEDDEAFVPMTQSSYYYYDFGSEIKTLLEFKPALI
ncbi:hypothetical protein Plhal703r1_c04g0021081 [Plasmopara halstedii]